jgi:hypothetical protein
MGRQARSRGQAGRRSAQQWAEVVDDWQRSGQRAGIYATAHDIDPKQLSWWRWRLGMSASRALATPEPLRLVGVEVVEDRAPTPGVPTWELTTVRGHVLRVQQGIAPQELQVVLQALLREPRSR